jgi:hypothetical protein
MQGRKVGPVKSGPGGPVWQSSPGPFNNGERRQAGTSVTPQDNIHNAIDERENKDKHRQRQASPICWQDRYGVSRSHAIFFADEFRPGEA